MRVVKSASSVSLTRARWRLDALSLLLLLLLLWEMRAIWAPRPEVLGSLVSPSTGRACKMLLLLLLLQWWRGRLGMGSTFTSLCEADLQCGFPQECCPGCRSMMVVFGSFMCGSS